ncbi:uncharacterized protein LOC131891571 [Tigriopus californicus]|uniref:uncharacterized protein LOC131891571 n=1 Tax=Tigriopus californicus TaxID=6832 RepID=UPI0027DA450C|nr:uncharacterized protein LOC131891571 [Tigriopus californicus]
MFKLGAKTVLQTDASKLKGLGFALMQLHEGEWKLIQCGSQFLKDAESRYAILELEALAIDWAIKKCRIYLAGLENFVVVTDHKPLRNIFNDQMLNAIENPRILTYRSRLSFFKFSVEWKCGKEHYIPDALSRAPVGNPMDEDDDPDNHGGFNLQMAMVKAGETNLNLDNLSAYAGSSPEYGALRSSVEKNTVIKISLDQANARRLHDDSIWKSYFDRTSRARKKIPLGQSVMVQNPATRRWDRHGLVVDNKSPRRYVIRRPSGRILERNLRFLRQAPSSFSNQEDLAPDDSDPNDDAIPRRSMRQRRQTIPFRA